MKRVIVLGSVFGLALSANGWTLAQESTEKVINLPVSLTSGSSIIDDPQDYVLDIDTPSDVPLPTISTILPADKETSEAAELVQQLFPNGMPRVTKYVALDSEGNYVNHGEYQEWSESGSLIVNGHYEMGLQQGIWVRFCDAKESKLFDSEPYKKFKAPFQSTAEFKNGKLHGVWTITDKDGKKVSEIQLVNGKRNGQALWFLPSGATLWQSEYQDGLLNGTFVEKDATGKVTRQTEFLKGQKAEKKTEYYANKKPRMEYQFLTAAQSLLTLDDWNSSTLAVYDAKGDEVKHGSFITYYENGSVRSQAAFKNGVQDGEFVSFYPNNQREAAGNYSNGRQSGKWSWWHENGMRKAIASYEKGSLVGTVLAWSDQGIRVSAGEFVNTQAEPTEKAQQSEFESSRPVSTLRRPGIN